MSHKLFLTSLDTHPRAFDKSGSRIEDMVVFIPMGKDQVTIITIDSQAPIFRFRTAAEANKFWQKFKAAGYERLSSEDGHHLFNRHLSSWGMSTITFDELDYVDIKTAQEILNKISDSGKKTANGILGLIQNGRKDQTEDLQIDTEVLKKKKPAQ